MGTSTDRGGGAGGAWTPLKHAATSFMHAAETGRGNTTVARRLLARHVAVFGGAAGAAATARAGRTGAQRLGAVLAGIGTNGLGATLSERGLGDLVGADRLSVLDALASLVAGDGADIDGQAARDAMFDVLDEMFPAADSWDDLDSVRVDADGVRHLLELFLARYVYNRIPVIAERLARLSDPMAAQRAEADLQRMVESLVHLQLPDDPLRVDWAGPQGRQIIDESLRAAYDALALLED